MLSTRTLSATTKRNVCKCISVGNSWPVVLYSWNKRAIEQKDKSKELLWRKRRLEGKIEVYDCNCRLWACALVRGLLSNYLLVIWERLRLLLLLLYGPILVDESMNEWGDSAWDNEKLLSGGRFGRDRCLYWCWQGFHLVCMDRDHEWKWYGSKRVAHIGVNT